MNGGAGNGGAGNGGAISRGRRLEPGTVLRLAEPDYLYGVGVLCLRLTTALQLDRLAALEWVRVVADEILWTGEISPARDVVVRVSAIPAAVRPPGWLPESAHRYRTGSSRHHPTGS